MLPISNISTQFPFQRLLRKGKEDPDFKDHEEISLTDHERLMILKMRLKQVRDERDEKLLRQPSSMISFEDRLALEDTNSKRQKYGKNCPQCQRSYEKTNMVSRALIPYRSPDKKVEVVL